MSEHLTPLDATFLELEQADESAHMHIGGIMVFDPLPDGGSPSREELCEHLGAGWGSCRATDSACRSRTRAGCRGPNGRTIPRLT